MYFEAPRKGSIPAVGSLIGLALILLATNCESRRVKVDSDSYLNKFLTRNIHDKETKQLIREFIDAVPTNAGTLKARLRLLNDAGLGEGKSKKSVSGEPGKPLEVILSSLLKQLHDRSGSKGSPTEHGRCSGCKCSRDLNHYLCSPQVCPGVPVDEEDCASKESYHKCPNKDCDWVESSGNVESAYDRMFGDLLAKNGTAHKHYEFADLERPVDRGSGGLDRLMRRLKPKVGEDINALIKSIESNSEQVDVERLRSILKRVERKREGQSIWEIIKEIIAEIIRLILGGAPKPDPDPEPEPDENDPEPDDDKPGPSSPAVTPEPEEPEEPDELSSGRVARYDSIGEIIKRIIAQLVQLIEEALKLVGIESNYECAICPPFHHSCPNVCWCKTRSECRTGLCICPSTS